MDGCRKKHDNKKKYLENNGENFSQLHRVWQCTIDEWTYLKWDDQIDLSWRNYVQLAELCIWISEQRMGINTFVYAFDREFWICLDQ